MPPVRNKTVRRKVVTGQSCLTNTEKLRVLRALYIVVYNSDCSLLPQATELYHLLGTVLEGTPVKELDMRTIDYATFLHAYDDLTGIEDQKKKPCKRNKAK